MSTKRRELQVPEDAHWTLTENVLGSLEPFEKGPQALTVIDTVGAKLVVFEFGPGQELHQHSAHHPIVIQILAGQATIVVDGHSLELEPGRFLHMTAKLPHAVVSTSGCTLLVSMSIPY